MLIHGSGRSCDTEERFSPIGVLRRLTCCLRLGVVTFSLTMGVASVPGATLQVGPGKPYADIPAAVAAARNGDTVEIYPATYSGAAAVAVLNKSLTIRGVGARPVLDAAGYVIPNGKAIFVAAAPEIAVENLEFKNAAVPDLNGAGIRPEGAKLTVRGCYFHDNENGIQGGAAGSDILVEYCEFNHNGHGDGQSHNLYIGAVGRFTFQFSYSHQGNIGHLLKTRANANYILYNRLTDETGGTASYEVDVAQGGLTYLVGNLIEQCPTTQNSTIVTFCEEGALNATNLLYVGNNTVVNDRSAGTFIRSASPNPALIINNLFVGSGTLLSGAGSLTNNLAVGATQLVNAAAYDYRLPPFSIAIDWGVSPGVFNGFDLTPLYEYVHPATNAVRRILAALDVGACESTDPASAYLHFTSVARTGGNLALNWLGNNALWQYLDCATNLASAAWVAIATNPPSGSPYSSKVVPADLAEAFFRLRATHP